MSENIPAPKLTFSGESIIIVGPDYHKPAVIMPVGLVEPAKILPVTPAEKAHTSSLNAEIPASQVIPPATVVLPKRRRRRRKK